jgi:hypothetical protein
MLSFWDGLGDVGVFLTMAFCDGLGGDGVL